MSFLLFVLAIVFFVLWKKSQKAAKKQANADAENLEAVKADLESAKGEINNLSGKVADLSKYQSIIDVEAECENMRAAAKNEAEAIKQSAHSEAASDKAAARASREAARMAREKAETAAKQTLSLADEQAKSIVADAEAKAREIAGDAYEAKQKADTLQDTIVSLKNIINGYGDEWLKPTYSLLDELAEDFGYTEAGQNLDKARKASALMVRHGQAGICDYAVEGRRRTAINFVVDAFNGKVDSILSKTKKDNYGKLEREIIDAFNLVNMNGEAFRNARISENYLKARLEELKWAVVCHELKVQQQEEQRRIREQMREEEKARREYERAQKEAQKEEAMLRKAMEKAQAALEKATAEQRANYESQLADLQQKLTEAEEKNQRALSMAQQTRHGHVYVISNIGSFGENVYKVGMTRRLEPMDRVKELGDASVPFPFDVHAIIESDDAPALETELHRQLALAQVNKVNPRKEFFRVPISDIKDIVESRGLSTVWTMTAEAAEYKETLAIEETLKNDANARERWEHQMESVRVADVSNQDSEE